MKPGGYVAIHRAIEENAAFREPWEAMAFAWLILRAAWKPTRIRYKGREVMLERGQLAITVRDFAEAMGRDRGWADRFLRRLRDRDMIVTVTVTGVNVVSICNYDVFQASAEGAVTVGVTATVTPIEEKKENKINTPPIVPPTRASSPKRATGIQPGFEPPTEWAAWARQNMGWTDRKVASELERFVDRNLAKGAVYRDWFAAWRQWCRSPYQKPEPVPEQQRALTL